VIDFSIILRFVVWYGSGSHSDEYIAMNIPSFENFCFLKRFMVIILHYEVK